MAVRMTVEDLLTALKQHRGPVLVEPRTNADWAFDVQVVKADLIESVRRWIERGQGHEPAPFDVSKRGRYLHLAPR